MYLKNCRTFIVIIIELIKAPVDKVIEKLKQKKHGTVPTEMVPVSLGTVKSPNTVTFFT